MGCFLACFGTSNNDHKRRKYRNQVQTRDHQRNSSFKALQSTGSSIQGEPENLVSSVQEIWEKPKEQPKASPRKRVTFDSNVRTYEHVPIHEDSVTLHENEKEEDLAKSSLAKSSSEESSTTSSLSSYPPNHRYQNCRESDDEEEELDFGDSDLDDEDEDDDDDDDGEIEYDDEIIEPKRVSEEVNSPLPVSGFSRTEVQSMMGLNRNARDRSGYVHSVLNPVENLAQWKAVKAKGTTTIKTQKENFSLDQESRISFSSEPAFKELSLGFKPKSDLKQAVKPKQETAVDASLSNWLISSETTPVNKTSAVSFDSRSPDRATSHGSNSVRSRDDERPILGALTVDEIRQFSATSSPRKSPSRSPDDMPIIGTVGTYWSHKDNNSGSATSFKGIPNTTSKYREDKKVNWHNTPFETRLERALNRGETEA